MKPSDRIKQLRDIRHEKGHGTDFTNRLCLGIMDYLDEEYEKNNGKAFLHNPYGKGVCEAIIEQQEKIKESFTKRKTLEEVLAVVTSLKDTSFGQMEDAKKRNEGYLFGLLDATNAIKQLYNQQ